MTSSAQFLLLFRLRHGFSQARLAQLLGVPLRRVAAWERGDEEPSAALHGRVLDLIHRLPSELMAGLSKAVVHSGLPRALSRTARLNLQALSGPAIDKRPTIVEWVGKDLVPIACGVLRSMLDDGALQRAIAKREVVSVVTTTRSVLRTDDAEPAGSYRTTINYFFHDGVLFSDAVAVPAAADERNGYTPLLADEVGSDLFGDLDSLTAALMARGMPALRVARS